LAKKAAKKAARQASRVLKKEMAKRMQKFMSEGKLGGIFEGMNLLLLFEVVFVLICIKQELNR
jgi:hypothetical protein